MATIEVSEQAYMPMTLPPVSVPVYSVYTLPTPPNSPRHSAGEKQDTSILPPTDTEQLVVLVAEDEETIAEALAMIIEDAGYFPVVAHDGREALALARQYRPHLIISDLMMPYLSGGDLIAAVRTEAAAQGQAPPPIIIVTAAGRLRAEETGADAVITKPFDVSRVEAVIHGLLGNHSR